MPGTQWWYAESSSSQEPIDESDLLALLRAGSLSLGTPVWRPGLPSWLPAREVSALVGSLPPTPPVSAYETAATPPPPPLPAVGVPMSSSSDQDAHKPWHRWFARVWLDYIFAGLLLGIILGIVAPDSSILSNDYALAWIAALLWIPLEAALLTAFGTTPGKYLVGLRVLTTGGSRLTYPQAIGRSFSVWAIGCALLIPLVLLFTFGSQYNRLKRGQQASWDERGGYAVIHSPLSTGRKVLVTSIVFLVVALIVLGALLPES